MHATPPGGRRATASSRGCGRTAGGSAGWPTRPATAWPTSRRSRPGSRRRARASGRRAPSSGARSAGARPTCSIRAAPPALGPMGGPTAALAPRGPHSIPRRPACQSRRRRRTRERRRQPRGRGLLARAPRPIRPRSRNGWQAVLKCSEEHRRGEDMPTTPRWDPDRDEVWTRVNDEGERVYISVQIEGGRVVAATHAYETAEDARLGIYVYGPHARWADLNRGTFEVAR